MKRLSLILAVVLSIVARTGAEEVIFFDEDGGGGNPRGLYTYETDTGQLTLRTTVGGNQRFFSLAYDNSGQAWAVAVNVSDLYTIDLDSGVFNFVSSTGLDTVADISFDPVTGDLYGLGRNTSLLYRINPNDGSSTTIGNASPVRSGLSFASDGTLYGVDVFSGALYTINKNTAQPTAVGSSGPTISLVEDATISSSNRMFVTNWSGQLYEIGLADGARTLLVNTNMGSGCTGIIHGGGGGGCNGTEFIKKAKCKTSGGAVKKAIVVVKNTTSGVDYTCDLATGQSLTVTAGGKAKFKFAGVDAPPCGPNTATVCGDSENFDCSC